jgi:rhodanese-related sulfurtransferase
MSDGGSAPFEQVTAGEAISLADGGTLLLDVREQDEWDRGHAPQATLIPMSQLTERVGELPDDAPILVICHSGVRSLRVTEALSAAGYTVVNVLGGMTAWQSAGGELVAEGSETPRV